MNPLATCGGNSDVAAAKFRVGEKREYKSGRRKHYFRRRIGLEYVEIVLPTGTDADWAGDRAALWDAAEVSEKRKDARVAFEIEVLLPRDLSVEQRIDLIRDRRRRCNAVAA